jgi:hypothetical protein
MTMTSHNESLPALWERKEIVGPYLISMRLKIFCSVTMFPRSDSGAITVSVLDIGNSTLIFDPLVNG